MGIKTAIKTNSVNLFLVLLPALDCLGRFLFWFKIVFNLSRHSDCVKQLTSSLMNTSCLANSNSYWSSYVGWIKKKRINWWDLRYFSNIDLTYVLPVEEAESQNFFKMPLQFYQSHLVEEVCTAISSSHQVRTMSCDSCFSVSVSSILYYVVSKELSL
jgi:hypothetical protein